MTASEVDWKAISRIRNAMTKTKLSKNSAEFMRRAKEVKGSSFNPEDESKNFLLMESGMRMKSVHAIPASITEYAADVLRRQKTFSKSPAFIPREVWEAVSSSGRTFGSARA